MSRVQKKQNTVLCRVIAAETAMLAKKASRPVMLCYDQGYGRYENGPGYQQYWDVAPGVRGRRRELPAHTLS